MRKSFIFSFSLLALAAIFACTREEKIVPSTVVTQGLGNGDVDVTYSVQVVPAGSYAGGRIEGISNAEVTVVQGGSTQKVTINSADGIAVFSGLKAGSVSGYVSAPNFGAVNFTADLSEAAAGSNADAARTRTAASKVTLMPRNASLEARIIGDFTFTGVTPIDANEPTNYSAVQVRVAYEPTGSYPMGSGAGKLTGVNFEPMVFGVTTNPNAPANNRFRINNLYPTDNGLVKASLRMVDKSFADPNSARTRTFNLSGDASLNDIKLSPAAVTDLGDRIAAPVN